MLTILIVVAAIVVLFSTPSDAQMVCGDRLEIVARLEAGYHERQRALGIAGNGAVIELWVSSKAETWSIIMTHPNGMACLLAAGESWESLLLPEQRA